MLRADLTGQPHGVGDWLCELDDARTDQRARWREIR